MYEQKLPSSPSYEDRWPTYEMSMEGECILMKGALSIRDE